MSTTTVCCGECSNHRIDVLGARMAEQGFVGCSLKDSWVYVPATRLHECNKFAPASEIITRRTA